MMHTENEFGSNESDVGEELPRRWHEEWDIQRDKKWDEEIKIIWEFQGRFQLVFLNWIVAFNQ